jgi:hypothetical protein
MGEEDPMFRSHSFVSASRHAVCGLALAVTALVAAAPARADSDFENAFERTLGHLLAYEAVAAGRAVLFGPPPVAVAVPVAAPVYYVPVPVAAPYPYPVPVYGYAPHHHHSVRVVHKTVVKKHYHGGHGRHDRHRDRDWDRGGRYARR